MISFKPISRTELWLEVVQEQLKEQNQEEMMKNALFFEKLKQKGSFLYNILCYNLIMFY